ncbi:VTT domain-containing protein [Ligilactobacillus sp. LYQ139]|uniref:VTT domain-containing protein n=1 Tax=Ligilactobacillus sp. LYQ139 TaxID=3378800 RepID=UPI00385219A4
MSELIHVLLHFDQYLLPAIHALGGWTYVVLFIMVFMETGLVFLAFLPGESLVFLTSSLAALSPVLDIRLLVPLFFCAALLGDTVNFTLGRLVGDRPWFRRLLPYQKRYQTQQFLHRHGGKTVIFGRFIPVIRAFLPLALGTSGMDYRRFSWYNFWGVFLWTALCSGIGYFFGRIPFVQHHFTAVFLGIIVILASTPAFTHLIQHVRKSH